MPDDLAVTVLGEVRTSLRGVTDDELVRTLGATPAQVAAVTERLHVAGALARRGTRWFIA